MGIAFRLETLGSRARVQRDHSAVLQIGDSSIRKPLRYRAIEHRRIDGKRIGQAQGYPVFSSQPQKVQGAGTELVDQ